MEYWVGFAPDPPPEISPRASRRKCFPLLQLADSGLRKKEHKGSVMKLYPVTLLLALALPLAAQTGAKDNKTTVYGRNVTVVTETTALPPAACEAAFDRKIDQQGWHDHIYSSIGDDHAVMIFTQRKDNGCILKSESLLTQVKVTLWKATIKNGKTLTETRVYRLSPTEVNDFLETDLPEIAGQFVTPTQKSS